MHQSIAVALLVVVQLILTEGEESKPCKTNENNRFSMQGEKEYTNPLRPTLFPAYQNNPNGLSE